MAGLDRIDDGPWPLGIVRAGAGEQSPPGSAFDIREMLIADDGSLTKRGPAAYAGTTALGTKGLTFIAAADLSAGQRALFGNASTVAALDSATLPSAHTTLSASFTAARAQPVRATPVNPGWMAVDSDGTNPGFMWAGGRKANYTTGTVSVTLGSATVTGSGTSWSTNVEAGMIFVIGSSQIYVKSVDSNTQVTLEHAIGEATASGLAYTSKALTAAPKDGFYGTVANRLLQVPRSEPTKLYFSPPLSPLFGPTATDYHQFPTQILGVAGVRDTALVFTSAGVYQITGMAVDLTDAQGNPQHRVEKISDKILWDRNGIAVVSEGLIVPLEDGIYMMDGVSAPNRISDPITDLYSYYVGQGYGTGVADTFKGHYFLPIWDQTTNMASEILVCRMEAAQGGKPFRWTRFGVTGATGGSKIMSFAKFRSTSGAPKLLGTVYYEAGTNAALAKVFDLTGYFDAPTNTVEADGGTVTPKVTTRSFQTGRMDNPNLVRKLRARYEMSGGGSLTAKYAADGTGVVRGPTEPWTLTSLTGTASDDTGTNPYTWPVGVRARRIRFELQLAGAAVLRRLTVFVRSSTKPN